MNIIFLQLTDFPILLDYRYSKWPLLLNLLICFMIIFILLKHNKQKANFKNLITSVDNRNYLLLLFATLVASGLLYFYQILYIGLLALTLATGYFLYKNYKANSALVGDARKGALHKMIALFVYSLLLLYSFHLVRKGSLTIYTFVFCVFILTALLIRFIQNNKFGLDKSLFEKKTSKRVIIFIFCLFLLNQFLYNLIQKTFAVIFNESVLNGTHYNAATEIFTKLIVLIAGAFLLTFTALWFFKNKTSDNIFKASGLFQKIIFSYTMFTFFLFYFGDLGYYTFSMRITEKAQSFSTSLSYTNIDGVYKYTGSNYSNKVESTVYINGSKWSATYFEKEESFGTVVESSSSSGFIKNNNLYDDNGFELGYISGREVYLKINGRDLSHTK